MYLPGNCARALDELGILAEATRRPDVQMKAGHSHGTITERYIHAAQVLFPGAAEHGENRRLWRLWRLIRVESGV